MVFSISCQALSCQFQPESITLVTHVFVFVPHHFLMCDPCGVYSGVWYKSPTFSPDAQPVILSSVNWTVQFSPCICIVSYIINITIYLAYFMNSVLPPSIYFWVSIIFLDLQINCTSSRKNSHIPFIQIHQILAFYITSEQFRIKW